MKKYITSTNDDYVLFELIKYDLEYSRLSELGKKLIRESIDNDDLLIAAESEQAVFDEELYYMFAIRRGANTNIKECLQQMQSAAGFIVPIQVLRSEKNINRFILY